LVDQCALHSPFTGKVELVPIGDSIALAAGVLSVLDNPVPKVLLDQAVIPFQKSRVLDRHFGLLGLAG